MREGSLRREGELEHARAAFIGVGPNMLAKAAIAVYLAIADRRVGKHGDEHGR